MDEVGESGITVEFRLTGSCRENFLAACEEISNNDSSTKMLSPRTISF